MTCHLQKMNTLETGSPEQMDATRSNKCQNMRWHDGFKQEWCELQFPEKSGHNKHQQ